MEEPSRAEKMVGEMIGLRLLVAQLLERDALLSGDPDSAETIRGASLTRLEAWPIGSDTPEGAERIRLCARTMLTTFPAPTVKA